MILPSSVEIEIDLTGFVSTLGDDTEQILNDMGLKLYQRGRLRQHRATLRMVYEKIAALTFSAPPEARASDVKENVIDWLLQQIEEAR